MAAKQRGDVTRTIILAHQVATMTGHLNSKAGLKRVDHYLKPVERSRKRRPGAAKRDDFDLLIKALERKARRQARQNEKLAQTGNKERED
jgi:hypothetical protein